MHTFQFFSIALSIVSLCTTITARPLPVQAQQDSQQIGRWGVIGANFPDPSFIKTTDGLYAFATSGNGKNIQIAKAKTFTDTTGWSMLAADALPNPGPWSTSNHDIWAPYVTQTLSGTFVMYYSAPPTQDTSKHCIGTATSNTVTGPYTPSTTPFACDLTTGGAIDASVFKDPFSSNLFVIYKVDGNSLGAGHSTPIMMQQISPYDGITRVGLPSKIFDQDPNSDTDGPLVEAPSMMYANGTYFLLFSTHMYNTAAYDVRYTTASALTGPYSLQQTVLLQTNDGNGVIAPGSCDVHDGKIVFHGTVKPDPNLTRDMYAGYVQAQGTTLTYTGSV